MRSKNLAERPKCEREHCCEAVTEASCPPGAVLPRLTSSCADVTGGTCSSKRGGCRNGLRTFGFKAGWRGKSSDERLRPRNGLATRASAGWEARSWMISRYPVVVVVVSRYRTVRVPEFVTKRAHGLVGDWQFYFIDIIYIIIILGGQRICGPIVGPVRPWVCSRPPRMCHSRE